MSSVCQPPALVLARFVRPVVAGVAVRIVLSCYARRAGGRRAGPHPLRSCFRATPWVVENRGFPRAFMLRPVVLLCYADRAFVLRDVVLSCYAGAGPPLRCRSSRKPQEITAGVGSRPAESWRCGRRREDSAGAARPRQGGPRLARPPGARSAGTRWRLGLRHLIEPLRFSADLQGAAAQGAGVRPSPCQEQLGLI